MGQQKSTSFSEMSRTLINECINRRVETKHRNHHCLLPHHLGPRPPRQGWVAPDILYLVHQPVQRRQLTLVLPLRSKAPCAHGRTWLLPPNPRQVHLLAQDHHQEVPLLEDLHLKHRNGTYETVTLMFSNNRTEVLRSHPVYFILFFIVDIFNQREAEAYKNNLNG